ncbi:histone deacetylase [Saccharomyces eubayanus]|uniref:histone deacetylase n=1 Tax=Saccharomyces eubayanus TaxID=1080349 RepID=UPI0006C27D80|nr:HOS3-like protein [Saccharomyces eubayanus]KOG96200.1 HOS3-like protein [Saccharomyces eubayanus]
MSSTQSDPLERFYRQFQTFVQNNPNVISAARAAAQIPESAKAVVVLSPYSLQHVFPREWVTKSYKKTIVERPERLLASSMGISAAITMYPSLFTLKSSHLRKGSLMAPHVLKVHGSHWPTELIELCQMADAKLLKGEIEVPDTWNSGDIYLSSKTIKALQGTIGAIETGVDSIFKGPSPEHISNRAFVAIRPPGHHCHYATPSGFCLLNNVHVAIEYAFDTYDVTHVVVLDFDLHHGDGTQDICWKRAGFKPEEESENSSYDDFGKMFAEFPKVGYFSMHDINSFPTESGFATKENIKNASTCIMNSHDLNIWNVHLSKWTTEEEFNILYRTKYRTLFAKADEFFKTAKLEMNQQEKTFKGLVVISAGFDASEFEQTSMQRHSVNVPTSFYTTFTKDALKLAQMHCHGKVLSLMEGGYSDKAICSGVFAHLIGLQNQDWVKEWGSEQVVKEIVRGCKSTWKPYKTRRAKDVIRIWAEEVIRLGRAMIPEFDDMIFKDIVKTASPDSLPTNIVEPVMTSTIAQRIIRSHRSSASPEKEIYESKLKNIEKEKPEERESCSEVKVGQPSSNNRAAETKVPFLQQEFSSEDEDEEYVYNEELNKTFNRTVEDITIDDISRHLETLEIEKHDEEDTDQEKKDKNWKSSHQRRLQSNGMYKIPSNTKPHRMRQTQNTNTPTYDDSDISMISHVSRKHTTRSGGRW